MVRLLLIAALTVSATARAEAEEVNGTTAMGVSAGVTLGGLVVTAATIVPSIQHSDDPNKVLLSVGAVSILYGPTAGHAWAGHYVSRGLALRLLAIGVLVLGGRSSCGLDSHESFCLPAPLLALGGGIFLAGMIDDFVTLPGVVRRRNAGREIAIGPAFGGRGLVVTGRF